MSVWEEFGGKSLDLSRVPDLVEKLNSLSREEAERIARDIEAEIKSLDDSKRGIKFALSLARELLKII